MLNSATWLRIQFVDLIIDTLIDKGQLFLNFPQNTRVASLGELENEISDES